MGEAARVAVGIRRLVASNGRRGGARSRAKNQDFSIGVDTLMRYLDEVSRDEGQGEPSDQ